MVAEQEVEWIDPSIKVMLLEEVVAHMPINRGQGDLLLVVHTLMVVVGAVAVPQVGVLLMIGVAHLILISQERRAEVILEGRTHMEVNLIQQQECLPIPVVGVVVAPAG